MMATLASNLLSAGHHFRNLGSTDGSISMDSNDFERESPNIDNTSCCSDDTVLSVGNENENPVQHEDRKEDLTFKNIESHLNAISKITNSTLDPSKSDRSSPISSTKSLPASPPNYFYKSSEKSNPASPESFANYSFSRPSSPQSPKDEQFFFKRTENNNETNQGSLKFSIDNILKADFGRRITDPINIRKAKGKKVVVSERAERRSLEHGEGVGASGATTGTTGPVDLTKTEQDKNSKDSATGSPPILWPAWVYCTRYSDRPSSGPRTRRPKKPGSGSKPPSGSAAAAAAAEEKRPRTAFSGAQLARLKHEFAENRYLTERRRQQLSGELGLNEAQIKIWFQNKRAKIKKASGQKNPLALQLMAQGLYNHSTIPLSKEEEEMQELHNTKPS